MGVRRLSMLRASSFQGLSEGLRRSNGRSLREASLQSTFADLVAESEASASFFCIGFLKIVIISNSFFIESDF